MRVSSSTTPSDLGAAWDEALSADRPVVLEVKTDPEIAPLPPHISLKEAKNFMFAMARDDDAAHVIKDTARQVDQRGPSQGPDADLVQRLFGRYDVA